MGRTRYYTLPADLCLKCCVHTNRRGRRRHRCSYVRCPLIFRRKKTNGLGDEHENVSVWALHAHRVAVLVDCQQVFGSSVEQIALEVSECVMAKISNAKWAWFANLTAETIKITGAATVMSLDVCREPVSVWMGKRCAIPSLKLSETKSSAFHLIRTHFKFTECVSPHPDRCPCPIHAICTTRIWGIPNEFSIAQRWNDVDSVAWFTKILRGYYEIQSIPHRSACIYSCAAFYLYLPESSRLSYIIFFYGAADDKSSWAVN